MQILFNELSLTGQFSDQDDFIKNALLPFIGILKEMQRFTTEPDVSIQWFKKSDAWKEMITPTSNLHSLLVARPTSDEVRRLKSAIADLEKEPFWDTDKKQNSKYTYSFNGIDVRDSSPAEACERDKIVVSFISSAASLNPLKIIRNEKIVPLLNLTYSGKLTEFLWANKQISFETYLKVRFSRGKLDFSRVDEKMGFSGIQSTEQSLFVDTFRKFDNLTWEQIHTDRGLYYKEYHKTIGVSYQNIRTYKFRVSQKSRCHGYREKESFIVIGFETDHKLSDQG